ncbi:MAG: glycosyltransferase family 4 protein [Candidatus Omnitrophica bacterium]|nr:glycosyltransferase family 4 protein [Candidatus Omnitrophota bacterium]
MRIGYNGRFFSSVAITGIERVASCLLQYLVRVDKAREYLLFVGSKNYCKDFLPDKVLVVECPLLKGNIYARHTWEQLELPFLIKKYDCDLLFNPANTSPWLVAHKSILLLYDVSFLINPSWFSRKFFLLYNTLIPPIARKAKRIITISENSKRDIVKYLKINPSKVSVVYLAPSELFCQEKKVLVDEDIDNLNIKKPFILFVGSLAPRKNLKGLIEAFCLLKKEKRIAHSLLIVGARNINFPLKEKNIDAGISRDIQFLGYLPDIEIKKLYLKADLFVYPSFYEGFGLPPLEAMSCGCPVVVSNTSCFPEIYADAAYYVDPYKPQSIAEGILKVLIDKELSANLVKKGLERVKLFSWEKAAEDTIKILDEIKYS